MTLFTLLFSSTAWAHVSNEKTIYDDIQLSEAKEEIVYLRGLNVIAYEKGANLFKPQDKLTKGELAFWVATYKQLGGHETMKEELQKAAVDKGFIHSLEGNATYADVNNAYFAGKATVEHPQAELTKEEFALFMGKYLTEKVDGKTLFETVGYEPGPTGVVEKVSFEMAGEGDNQYKVFRFQVGGKEYQVSQHPKILYGPVDLSVWEGKKIKESWLTGGHGAEKEVHVIVLEQGQFSAEELGQVLDAKHSAQPTETAIAPNSDSAVATEQPAEKELPIVLIAVVILLVLIVGWLFLKK